MKKILTAILLLMACLNAYAMGEPTIMVMSDIHTMAPKLVTKSGSAFTNYAANDMRMIDKSSEILTAMVDKALKEKPWLVLITGDLTKDGELLSHQFVVAQLQRLNKAGIKVLVIPGNHDISNANAKKFNGDKTSDAATIDRAKFAELYRDFGYGTDSKRDPNSLSYVCEPINGVVVIGIDSNRDEENLLKSRGDSTNTYHTAGRVKPETLTWITEQAREAKAQGKQVIAMMHHHLLEHFDQEAQFLSKYVVADHEEVRDALVQAGVHVILTGHLHITDISRDYVGTDSITDVATGSMITYPFLYRNIKVRDNDIEITTGQLKSIPSDAQLVANGKAKIENAVPGLVDGFAHKAVNKMKGSLNQLMGMMTMFGGGEAPIDLGENSEGMIQLIHQLFDDIAKKAYIAVLEGNEGKNPNSKEVIDGVEANINKALETTFPGGMSKMIQGFLEESAMPQLDALLRSIMEDRNHCGTSQEVVVDDLETRFDF